MKDVLENEGRIWLRSALSETQLHNLDKLLSDQASKLGARLKPPTTLNKKMNSELGVDSLVEPFFQDAKAVRFISFNKSKKQNWSLPWHQDRVIAVRKKVRVPGFTNWSRKSGIWHCEPLEAILKNMIFARVYLDDVTKGNGSLELAIGSHKFGKIKASKVDEVIEGCDTEICEANRGDVLLVKALTLHKSGVSTSNAQRRALRIDYAVQELPAPLKWKYIHI